MTDETGGKPTLASLLSTGYGGTLAKLMEADADHVTIPTAALAELVEAAEECADALAVYRVTVADRLGTNPERIHADSDAFILSSRLRAALEKVRAK